MLVTSATSATCHANASSVSRESPRYIDETTAVVPVFRYAVPGNYKCDTGVRYV